MLRQATGEAWSAAWSAACRTQRKMPGQSVAAAKASRSLEPPGSSEPGVTQGLLYLLLWRSGDCWSLPPFPSLAVVFASQWDNLVHEDFCPLNRDIGQETVISWS